MAEALICVEGEEERSEDRALRSSGAGDNDRCDCTDPHSLWSLTEEVANPGDKELRYVEVVKLLDHRMALNCVQTEWMRSCQVILDVEGGGGANMQQHHSFPSGTYSKLIWTQLLFDSWKDGE